MYPVSIPNLRVIYIWYYTGVICIVPYFNRPAFLYFTLQSIIRSDIPQDIHFHFHIDYGYNPVGLEYINAFPYPNTVHHTPKIYSGAAKLSYNILTAYKLHANNDYVFMIEDDIIVEADFFTWHLAQHTQPILASIGSLPKPQTKAPYDYQSWGVCFTGKALRQYVVPHINHMYFRHPEKYLSDKFPDSHLGVTQSQQQGLIRRVATHIPCKYPTYPVCHNFGFASLQVGYFEFAQMPIAAQIKALQIYLTHGGIF